MIAPPPSVVREWGDVWVSWIAALWQHLSSLYIASGTVSLTSDGVATTTVVSDNAARTTSRISLLATDTGAATEAGGTALYVSAKANGNFTITHSASASARTFDYIIVNR